VLSNELYQITNLGLLCEDVITGMIAANGFRGLESRDSSAMDDTYSKYSICTQQNSVDVTMDIERRDWSYRVQPGAIRRIIMNIFGNAQKYTASGYILVELKGPSPDMKTRSSSNPNMDVITLHVRDSGRGMSTAYVERKLYHPFSQEDSFSAGIGLGLSIV
jgi:signal transduction histidine kinase